MIIPGIARVSRVYASVHPTFKVYTANRTGLCILICIVDRGVVHPGPRVPRDEAKPPPECPKALRSGHCFGCRWRRSPAALCESAWQTPSLYIYEPMQWNMNFDSTSSCVYCAHVWRLVLCVRVCSSVIGIDLLVKVYLHRQHRALDTSRSRLQMSVQRSRPSQIRSYAGVHVAYCGVNVRSSGTEWHWSRCEVRGLALCIVMFQGGGSKIHLE